MVWIPASCLDYRKFGEKSGHGDRPAYSVTPRDRGLLCIVLPCTSEPVEARERFYEMQDIHYQDLGDRPYAVYKRTWIYEEAQKVNFREIGPLARYATLPREEMPKPFAWWSDRGRRIRDEPAVNQPGGRAHAL